MFVKGLAGFALRSLDDFLYDLHNAFHFTKPGRTFAVLYSKKIKIFFHRVFLKTTDKLFLADTREGLNKTTHPDAGKDC